MPMVDYRHETGAPGAENPLTRVLLDWFAREQRDLPWRRTRDPYRIWVAETMLIQTQVTTVIPYYERFLARFPDVAALAAAPLDDVLKAWEGLGYYARARNLHRAAKEIVQRHGGCIPDDPLAVRALPGMGAYTAAAVLSIAFGRDEAALDGNIRRVLARLYWVTGAPEARATQAELEGLARTLLPGGEAGAFNQALMDLGATICRPRRPCCAVCPVAAYCEARRRGGQEQVPAPRQRRALLHYEVTAAVIRQGEQVLISQRRAEGLLGGLWEFPGGKQEAGETLPECLQREIREELGIEIEVSRPLIAVEHGYTHFSITLHAFHCRLLAGEPQPLACADWRWVRLAELEQFAFSAADRKIIAALRAVENESP